MSYLEKQAEKMSKRGLMLLGIIPSISFVAGGFFFSENLFVIFIIGLFLGVTTIIVVFWRDKYVKKEENYIKGLKGERFMENWLKNHEKSDNFKFIYDIKLKYGNADFVVINENGVFCIDEKNTIGKITYDKTSHCLFSGNITKDYLKQVKRASFHIQQLITGNINYVRPILVFSAFGVNVEVEDIVEDVYIVKSGKKLIEFLKIKTGRMLDKETQSKIYEVLLEYKKEHKQI